MQHGATSDNSFNSVKQSIAERLERAACSLKGQPEQESTLGPYSRQTSEWLHQSAEYVKEFDLQRADIQLRNQIKIYPGRSVLIGLAAGMLVRIWICRR